MHCPYCGYDKPDEFTDEHVVPRALGGGVQPTNPFILRICEPCNSACGRWIDGPFVRSWLIHNARAACAVEFCDPTAKPVVPLTFIGAMKAWSHDGTICDFWLGPFGDHIYHVHQSHPDQPTFVGKPPHVRNSDWDPGAVYIAYVTRDPIWHDIIWRSAKAALRGAPIHFVNAAPKGHLPPHPPVPTERAHHIEFIKSLPVGEMRDHEVAISTDLGARFLAKLALGFGCLFLSPGFATSSDAAQLRRFLWGRNSDERDNVPIRGSGFLGSNEELVKTFGWESCHTLALFPSGGELAMVVVFYGRHGAALVMSSDPNHWRGHMGDSGAAWVVAPGLRRCAGPTPLAEFLVEKHSGNPTGVLADLCEQLARASRFEVPPRSQARR
ncbi:MAG: HNH endonuclease [Myxococcales bacterium]|nr:HNH endonuclease [Myxococcales bacterium]